jgi:hypothetical protein
MKSLNEDICPLANPLIVNKIPCESLFLGTMKNGFKAVSMRYFELIRYLGVQIKDPDYQMILNSSEFYEIGKINKLLFLLFIFNFKFIKIDQILKHIIRVWFDDLLDIQMLSFTDYLGQINLINVSSYIVLIVSIIIIYSLIWKSFEEKLKELVFILFFLLIISF